MRGDYTSRARGLPPPRTPGACGELSAPCSPELRCAPHRSSRGRRRACACSRSPPRPRAWPWLPRHASVVGRHVRARSLRVACSTCSAALIGIPARGRRTSERALQPCSTRASRSSCQPAGSSASTPGFWRARPADTRWSALPRRPHSSTPIRPSAPRPRESRRRSRSTCAFSANPCNGSNGLRSPRNDKRRRAEARIRPVERRLSAGMYGAAEHGSERSSRGRDGAEQLQLGRRSGQRQAGKFWELWLGR